MKTIVALAIANALTLEQECPPHYTLQHSNRGGTYACAFGSMPVAQIAIMRALTYSQALVAGFFVGAVTLVGGLTRLIDFLALLIPLPVIRGVQLQVGCKLALKVREHCHERSDSHMSAC
eukprot:908386-Pelagomonas_calceolata.AAC.3